MLITQKLHAKSHKYVINEQTQGNPGGMVLLDAYAFVGYELSKKGMDAFAAKNGVEILSLPTGQCLLVKSPE